LISNALIKKDWLRALVEVRVIGPRRGSVIGGWWILSILLQVLEQAEESFRGIGVE